MNWIRFIGTTLTIALALGLYQNCSSKMDFSQLEKSQTQQDEDNASNDENVNEADDTAQEDPANPPDQPGQEEPATPPTQPDSNEPVDFADCSQFQEITETDIRVPERKNDGICYYVRLMSAIEGHKSGSFGEARAEDVMASNHDGDQSEYMTPYILADKELELFRLSDWKLAISGAYDDPEADMAIDNFFLIEAHFPSLDQDLMWGMGSADAEPGSGAQPILVNGSALENYTSYIDKGTAVVKAIDVKPQSQESIDHIDFRFRGLDCGSWATGTDVFLVFH